MGMPVSFTMSQTGVRLSLLLSILTISKVFGACEDYTCKYEDYIPGEPGKSITRIPVDYGDKCNYDTQEGKDYPPPEGVKCITVTIVRIRSVTARGSGSIARL